MGAASLSLDWDIDVAKRRMTPRRCLALCSRCGTLRHLPRLIDQLTRQQVPLDGNADGNAAAASGEILRHFLRVNGHDAADAHQLQDVVSVAHSMHVIYKELRFSPSKGPPLQELLKPGAAASTNGAHNGNTGSGDAPVRKAKRK